MESHCFGRWRFLCWLFLLCLLLPPSIITGSAVSDSARVMAQVICELETRGEANPDHAKGPWIPRLKTRAIGYCQILPSTWLFYGCGGLMTIRGDSERCARIIVQDLMVRAVKRWGHWTPAQVAKGYRDGPRRMVRHPRLRGDEYLSTIALNYPARLAAISKWNRNLKLARNP